MFLSNEHIRSYQIWLEIKHIICVSKIFLIDMLSKLMLVSINNSTYVRLDLIPIKKQVAIPPQYY